MTEAAGRFAGMTALEAREAVVAALREEGRINRTEPYTHQVPHSQRSRRADRAADLAAVVHEDGGAGRAGDRRGRGGAGQDPPRGPAQALPGLAEQHPPVVHLAPAVVGPPDPRLLPRQRDLRRDRSARGPGLGARPGRPGHLVLQRAVAVRDARLARPDRRAEGLLSHRRPADGARHPLPVGRPHGLHGAGVRRRHPVRRRLRALGRPGARRAADVEVARHGHRPAGADRRRPAPARLHRRRRLPGLRRGRRPLRAAGDVLHAGRPLQRGHDRRGPPARQQALQRLAARAAAGPRRRDRPGDGRRPRRPSRTSGSCRACRPPRPRSRTRSPSSSSTARPARCTASSTRSCATGTWRCSSRGCTRTTTRPPRSSRCTSWPRRSRWRIR